MTCTQRAPRVSFSDKRAMQPCDSSPAMIRPVLVYAGVGGLLVVAGRQVRVVLRLAASRRARAQHFSRQPRGRLHHRHRHPRRRRHLHPLIQG